MLYEVITIRIVSGGVRARHGGQASQVVQHVARIHGFSLKGHRSDPLTSKTIRKADAILVMEQYQKDEIIARFPEAREKTFRMMEYLWSGDPDEIHDIPDPTGQNTADYEDFIDASHAEVERIFRELGRTGIL